MPVQGYSQTQRPLTYWLQTKMVEVQEEAFDLISACARVRSDNRVEKRCVAPLPPMQSRLACPGHAGAELEANSESKLQLSRTTHCIRNSACKRVRNSVAVLVDAAVEVLFR